jgi:urate oxidase
VQAIPESAFRGRPGTLLAAEVDVEVLGERFLPAYTEGDNSMVVATDSIKNFVLRESLSWRGATLEGLLHHLGSGLLTRYEQMEGLRVRGRELRFDAAHLGSGLLTRYEQMEGLRVRGRELRFDAATVPGLDGPRPSDVLLERVHGDHAAAWLELAPVADGATVAAHGCARRGLELLKVRGSAFTRFVRDGYTTLPERADRPLYITVEVSWRYHDPADAIEHARGRYVASEQVRDLVCAVFDGFVSESIQHLVHEMGVRLLARFPQLAEVSFEAANLTRDPVATDPDDEARQVWSDPFPAHGTIELTLARA